MPIFVQCPSGHRLKVPRKRAGHRIICPVCEQSIPVPPLAAPLKKETDTAQHSPHDLGVEKSIAPSASTDYSEDKLATAETPSLDSQLEHSTSSAPTQAPREESAPPATIEHDVKTDGGIVLNLPELPTETPVAASLTDNTSREDTPLETLPRTFESQSEAAPSTPFEVYDQNVSTAPVISTAATVAVDQVAEWDGVRSEPELDFSTTPQAHAPLGQIQLAADFQRDQAWVARWLGFATLIVAAICATPSIVEFIAYYRELTIHPVDVWTYLALLGAIIQLAIGVYAIQLPDWSTSWVASLTATGFAAIYALGLALTMFANQEHSLVHQLGLLDEAQHGRAQAWCCLVMCLTLILAYGYGRFSLRWYQVEKQLHGSRTG